MTAAPRVADTLADAGPRDLVHVDRKGRVRSRARSRAVAVAYWGLLATLVGIEGYLGYELFGWPGLSIAATLGGYVGWIFTRVGYLKTGVQRLVANDLSGSEAAFERVATARLTPKHLRARAWGGLASAARLRGDDALALEHIRKAIGLYKRSKRATALTAQHMEAQLLARLGRLEEARAVLAELPSEAPEGEYTRLSHYTTELYVAFREGKHRLSDDALHERATFALGITSAAPLLALLGWAFQQNGDPDMAELVIVEARDRHPGELMTIPMPELSRWLDDSGSVDKSPPEISLRRGASPSHTPPSLRRCAPVDSARTGVRVADEDDDEEEVVGARLTKARRGESR
ncbi:MAG: hypothetical protein H6719_08265 [Sandaracinaceae bacterium]|nr:hypothetical protein [Sandaracinaceae bacterium]